MRVAVPFCPTHAGHWRTRNWIIVGGLLVLVGQVLPIAGIVHDLDILWDSHLFFLPAGGFVCWVGMIVVLRRSAIRATEITDRSITLTNVSRKFVEAAEEEMDDVRHFRSNLDREAEERWAQRETDREDPEDRYQERSRRFEQGDEAPR
jgi:hypothetical protein